MRLRKKLRISRPKVSRLLTEARSEGVVQITVSSLSESFEDLERELEAKAGLKDSSVVSVSDPDDPEVVSQDWV